MSRSNMCGRWRTWDGRTRPIRILRLAVACAWWTGTVPEEEQYGPHVHEADEYLGLIGSNPEDFRDLCGEVEWWFEDEKYTITKSCLIWVPAGVKHAPIVFRRIDRPIFFFSTVKSSEHSTTHLEDPKFSHMKGPRGGLILPS